MSEIKQTLNSSLGKKLIMALTGLFLCTFLIVHLAGNLQLFKNDGGYGFNVYANFLTHFPPIEVIAYILYLSIIVHAVYALVFILIHMSDFCYSYKFTNKVGYKEYRTDLATNQTTSAVYTPQTADFENSVSTENNVEIMRVKDLQARVANSFTSLWYVIFYVIAMGAVAFHLLHGFQSAFRTLGWVHRKYTPIVYFIGTWFFAVIIPIGFAAMPVVYYIQSLK
jgi:succinate dehydrogenase / fumarate reductase cytochrome b subunit